VLRFSVKHPVAKAFVSRFVHAGVPAGSDDHERHRVFLTVCGTASGLGLGIVPLFVAGNQAQPGLWAAVAAAAAVPFFLAVAVSRSGRLEAVLKIATVLIAVLIGTLLAVSARATSNLPFVPLTLISAFACFEPVLWRMRRSVLVALVMAVIIATVALIGTLTSAEVPIAGLWGAAAPAILWCFAAIYAVLTLVRLARTITEAESASKRDKERYELVASNAGELICTHDRNGKSLFVSPACNSITGAEPSDYLGKGFTERVHLQDRIVFLQAVSDVWQSRSEQKIKLRLRRKGVGDRAWIWIETVLRAQFSTRGTVTSIVAVSRDITAEVERDLQRSHDEDRAQKSDAAQKRFIATMSHELRTPLNAIIGFSDVLEQELFGKLELERHREYVSHINSSGQHLLQVVNDLLDMSRIDANRYELDMSEFSLSDVVDATLAMLTPLAGKAGVTVARETNDNLPPMRGDRRSWQQILINLVSNAIKFTPEDGTVRLTTRQFGRNVKIIVRDTGIGIDPEFLNSIGQPFMQAESGPDRRFEGSGLGLSVVKGLVDLHGGDFQIESAPGKGTTATVILPMQPAIARPVPHTEDMRVIGLPESGAAHEKHSKSHSKAASKGDSHARLSA